MIEDVALAALPVRYRPPHQLAQLLVVHERVRAERHQVIQGGHARSQLSLEEVIHQRHGHGARAVGDDDEHALAIHGERAQALLRDAADFLAGQITVRESFSDDHGCYSFRWHGPPHPSRPG